MRIENSTFRRILILAAAAMSMLVSGATTVIADEISADEAADTAAAAAAARDADFVKSLARVDWALKKNPKRVSALALESCLKRRIHAARLYYAGQITRAERSLKYCFDTLGVSEKKPAPTRAAKVEAITLEDLEARAERELELALTLTPNIENGLEIYRSCAACHMPEGWGLQSGMVPQVAGQHRKVVIKQLADTRAGNRDNVLMVPYSSAKVIGGPQAVADVAGYIDTLEISIDNGKGAGDDLEFGKSLYQENCERCHGTMGEGNGDEFMPRIQAQHYNYLVRQFEWIRDGKRRNADPDMVIQIEGFEDREVRAVLDYVSRLEPPEEFRAPTGWRNPDFIERPTVARPEK